ncbi:MAG TPA: helix-turn-helix domain-containing protein [Gemmataceae bacterium]|nr:helix-turn-helix domain-containing protein [Gemmataceae bacterium]
MNEQPTASIPTAPETAPERLAVGAKDLARMLGISVATFWRWDASGELGPPGLRKGGRRLWPLAEIRMWVAAGMPNRAAWVAQSKANGKPSGPRGT